MKLPLTIITLFFFLSVKSQNSELLNLVFSDSSNFSLIKSFGDELPKSYVVLSNTEKWNSKRFYLYEPSMMDSMKSKIAKDEHHPYNHTYIFKDTSLNNLFDDSAKKYLSDLSQTLKVRNLNQNASDKFSLIKSYRNIKKGFFFSITDPIISSNEKFAFIDIIIYKKDKSSERFNETYFGTTLIIFQRTNDKGWIRLRKLDHLIL